MLGHFKGHLGHFGHLIGHLGSLGHDSSDEIERRAICLAKNQHETTHTHELARGLNFSVMLGHFAVHLGHLGHLIGHLWSLVHDCSEKIEPCFQQIRRRQMAR